MSIKTVAFGGKHTPEQVLLNAIEHVHEYGAQCVVVVLLDGDDYIQTSHSDGSATTKVGLLEWGKRRLMAMCEGENDDRP